MKDGSTNKSYTVKMTREQWHEWWQVQANEVGGVALPMEELITIKIPSHASIEETINDKH